MKIFYRLPLLLALAAVSMPGLAQKKDSIADQYRRSSLALILMDEEGVPHKEVIKEAFVTAPMPEKYNDHNVARFFPMEDYRPSAEEAKQHKADMKAAGHKQKGKGMGFLKVLGQAAAIYSGNTAAVSKPAMVDSEKRETINAIATKYLRDELVAKQLFDRWFIVDSTGQFTMDLVQERGLYDASVMDVETARSSVRGMGMLADAGEELIKNTFVVVSRFRYISKDELKAEIEAAAQGVAAIAGAITGTDLSSLAAASSLVAGVSMGEGYYVRITSFLFQLEWNEEVAGNFYALWNDRQAYDTASFFKLNYVGEEVAFAGVKASVFTKLPEEELIRIATVNATDAVLAKLERKYDVFKTKTPLISVDPLTAHIGMKEGVAPGDKFEVLERVMDPETGRTTYNRKGVIEADKVWDNRYMASEEAAATTQAEAEGSANAEAEDQVNEATKLTATQFKGSGNYYPGMLLRYIRATK